MDKKITSMRPSAYYMRRALRSTDDPARLREVGLHCVAEYERLREWVRAQGMIPPKFEMLSTEAKDKGIQAVSE